MVEGSANYIFAQKLKMLKERILKWKKENFGGLKARKSSCLSELDKLGQKGMMGDLEEDEKSLLLDSKADYNRLLRMEEISWR